mgnify:CR=1 FL=1
MQGLTEPEHSSSQYSLETIDSREICREALTQWGEQAQITMVFEEMAELQKELCKYLRGKDVTEAIAEEIADVELMLEQMKLLFNIEEQVEDVKRCKLMRLSQRLATTEAETMR